MCLKVFWPSHFLDYRESDSRFDDPVLPALPNPSDGVNIQASSPPPDSVVLVDRPTENDAQFEEEIRSRFCSVGNSSWTSL